MKISEEQILEALKHVDDPDLKKDLVSLNMIRNIKIKENIVSFDLVLTTPACPLKGVMEKDCIDAIHKYVSEDLEVEVIMESNVSTRRKDTEAMLKGVKNIIAVAYYCFLFST